jgi:hypothetical protein
VLQFPHAHSQYSVTLGNGDRTSIKEGYQMQDAEAGIGEMAFRFSRPPIARLSA